MFLLVYAFLGWKFGNWKDFNRYYPTILFFIIGDLLSQFLLFDYSMWEFHAVTSLDQQFKLNHTLISLLKMLIQYTVTISIFIGRKPKTFLRKVLWVGVWTSIYGFNEGIAHYLGMLTYDNGWNFGWDILFNVLMFTVLLIHYKRPLMAWIFSVPIILGLWIIFNVPYSALK